MKHYKTYHRIEEKQYQEISHGQNVSPKYKEKLALFNLSWFR